MFGHRRQVWCDSCTHTYSVFAENEDEIAACPSCGTLTILVTCDNCAVKSELMTPGPGQTHWICPACKVSEQFSAETLTHFHEANPTVWVIPQSNPPTASQSPTNRRRVASCSTGVLILCFVLVGFAIYTFGFGATTTTTPLPLPTQPATPMPGLIAPPQDAQATTSLPAKHLATIYEGLDDPRSLFSSQSQLVGALSGTVRHMSYDVDAQVAEPFALQLVDATSTRLPNDSIGGDIASEDAADAVLDGAAATDWVRYDNSQQINDVRNLRVEYADPSLIASFAPDDTRYAFHTYSETLARRELWVVDSASETPKRSLATPYSIEQIAWSPDSTLLLFTGSSTPNSGLFLLNVDTFDVSRLVETTAQAIGLWLDNETIIFSAETDQGSALFSHNIYQELPQRFTTDSGNVTDPHLSADGQFLTFSADWAESYDLYTINLWNGIWMRLTFTQDRDERMPVWSP